MNVEEMTKKIENFIKFSEQFLQSAESNTQRAGIVLIDSMYSAGLRDNRVKSKLSIVTEIFDKISHLIGEFYINIKEEKDLSESMKHSAWKNIMIMDGAKEYLVKMKDSKNLIIDSLFLISTFINSGELEIDEIKDLVKHIMEIKNHPDEDIKIFIADMMSHLFSKPEYRPVMKVNLKSILMLIFANLKSEAMKEDVFINKSQLMVLVIFFEMSQSIPTLKENFMTALNSVVGRSLKYYKRTN
jgi:hypothetical protein